jgi:hypothetical protein
MSRTIDSFNFQPRGGGARRRRSTSYTFNYSKDELTTKDADKVKPRDLKDHGTSSKRDGKLQYPHRWRGENRRGNDVKDIYKDVEDIENEAHVQWTGERYDHDTVGGTIQAVRPQEPINSIWMNRYWANLSKWELEQIFKALGGFK